MVVGLGLTLVNGIFGNGGWILCLAGMRLKEAALCDGGIGKAFIMCARGSGMFGSTSR